MSTENRIPETLASEVIADQESRLKNIVTELDGNVLDSLEKIKFITANLTDVTSTEISSQEDAMGFALKREEINMFLDIVLDYVCQTQGTIERLIDRTRRESEGA